MIYCIYGSGGFALESATWLRDSLNLSWEDLRKKLVFMVDDDFYNTTSFMKVPVIPRSKFDSTKYQVVVAVGDPQSRNKMVTSLPNETKYFSIIHPKAIIGHNSEIGLGSIVCPGVIVTSNVSIGNHAHLNLNTTVGHDCIIGDYLTTAPSVNISGNNNIGALNYFGTQSATKEKLTTVDHVIVGMGAMVLHNLEKAGVYVGIPARIK